ncbi:hypothetical protein HK096_009095, partial [Nowakowskiella sp. JEL0078]
MELLVKFVLSASSASISELVTFPIDTTKTRLQIQQISSNASSPSILRTARAIANEGGISSFYKGSVAAAIRHVPYTGTRVLLYEYLRTNKLVNGNLSTVSTSMIAGFISGAAGQFVANPADLIKVRMQIDGQKKTKRYRSSIHALQTILKKEGVRGLWRGCGPSVTRAALVNLGELATYDQAKQFFIEFRQNGHVAKNKSEREHGDDLLTHILSSTCSGFVSALISTPADVLKTRLMNQDLGAILYTGMCDCLVKSVKKDGVLSLWRGFLPIWARLAPWQLVFWVSYENLRKSAGIAG